MVIKTMFAFLLLGLFYMLFKSFREELNIEDNEKDLKEDLNEANLELRKQHIKSDVLDVKEDLNKLETKNVKRQDKLGE